MGKYFNFHILVIWRQKGLMLFLNHKRTLEMNIRALESLLHLEKVNVYKYK